MEERNFGQYLAKRRKSLGLSQQNIADILMVASPTISKWEKNKNYPDLSYICDLAKILEVDLTSLGKLEETKNNTYCDEYKFDINNFATHFSRLRKMNGYTLSTLQEKLGIRYQTISLWEKGESLPSFETLLKCASLFNVSIDELYFGRELKPITANESPKSKNNKNIFILLSLVVVTIIATLTIIGTQNKNGNNTTTSNNITIPNTTEVVQTTSSDTSISNKILIRYEFNMHLDPIELLIDKGSKATRYEPNIEGYSVHYYYNYQKFDFDTILYEDTTLNGIFTINKYDVTFYDINNDIAKRELVNHGEKANAPILDQYINELKFYGWSEDFSCVKQNLNIYPIYINNDADINLNPNGGTCSTNQIPNYNNSMYDSLPIPYKKGYEFVGWYLNNELFTKETEITTNIVLVARYTPILYKITLDPKGGHLENLELNVYYDSKVVLPIPTKDNSTFNNWHDKNDKIYDLEFYYSIDSDITLYAEYTTEDNLDNYQYTLDESNKTFTITKYTGRGGQIILPKEAIINDEKYTLQEIKDKAFYSCSIYSLFIPNTIIKIGDEAFSNISSLEKIEFEENSNLQYIGTNAFYGCLNIKNSIAIPNSVKTIGANAFDTASRLIILCENESKPSGWDLNWAPNCQVYWNANKKDVVEIDKAEYLINNNEATLIQYLGNEKNITIPGKININGVSYNVNKIGDCAFKDNSYLCSITIEDNITSIGKHSFSMCCNLENIILPNSLTEIGSFAFAFNSKLTSIIIPKSVEVIKNYAFTECSSLIIYCESEEQPSGFESSWNDSNRPVTWGYKK